VDYQKIYDSLISRAKVRNILDYTEKHHIVPRCLGGSDDLENLVCLTPEEHYLAHQLLTKLYPKHEGLARAAHMMCTGRPTNKYYGWVRRRFAEAQRESVKGENNPCFNTRLIFNPAERKTKRISIDEVLPEGWREGAVYDFDAYFERLSQTEQKKKIKAQKLQAKIENLRNLHKVYSEEGFQGVLKTGYDKSKANLVMQFAKYLPEFVPQNGKRRGG
jgi:hypothetical protein